MQEEKVRLRGLQKNVRIIGLRECRNGDEMGREGVTGSTVKRNTQRYTVRTKTVHWIW